MKKIFSIIGAILIVGVVFLSYSIFIKKADYAAENERIVVPILSIVPPMDWQLRLALILRGKILLESGGYKVLNSQTAWQASKAFTEGPYMKWVILKEGLRKEQIAEILTEKLGWTEEQKNHWIKVSTAPDATHTEGVYFPDNYLIPLTETPDEVALRMRRRFDEKFAPLAKEALAKNIKWTTVVTMASLIQREAAGKHDMALIAGVMWNRLEKGMKLDIDATLQYITGNEEDGWWGKVLPEDKKSNSPFNTYISKGLPPHPIANPGLDAMGAVINPEKTKCFFYLHAPDKKIYCAVTFEEHKENIEKYLRN